jgi:quercetin dioxygenase-like cupin family protein
MRRTWVAALTVLAFIAGLVLGIGGMSLRDLPPRAAPSVPSFAATGRLESLPQGPVEVITETVQLGRGFTSRHQHGGPTFNFVVAGRVQITEDNGMVKQFGPGEVFFEPADRPHTIEVLSEVRMDVLRLIPPGAAATTTLPSR